MNFGLDSCLLHPFFSLLISYLLFIGVYSFGSLINTKLKFNVILGRICNVGFVNLLIGLYFLSYILFFLSLFSFLNKIIFQFISVLLIFLGIFQIKMLSNYYRYTLNLIKNNNIYSLKFIIFILLFLYFVISSGPITNADALDYHVGVPISILNYGHFPTDWTWFHARQAGAGELLISLGLSICSELFGNLAQYSGLISIIGLFFYLGKKKEKKNIIENFKIIGFLSSPILIF